MRLRQIAASAFVIARRDFTATVMSKAFLLFLLGPLFPVLMGVAFGGIGARIDQETRRPVVVVVGSEQEFTRLSMARSRLAGIVPNDKVIELTHASPQASIAAQRESLLKTDATPPVLGVLEGGIERPSFTGAVTADGPTVRQLNWMLDDARRTAVMPDVPGQPMRVTRTSQSSGSLASARALTARAGQTLLFFLTILLAGMLLSQLIEEKSNKVIEILAAAVPVDAIFIGKLFAMLAMSLVGIAVWSAAGAAAIAAWSEHGLGGLPEPAVGWPVFLALVPVYFAMSYLLIGAVFLGIGGQASTVREVQTLSMPVTMAQVMLFAFASMGVGNPGRPEAIGAAVFPLSSPFAMIGRAAEEPALWPHLLAFVWQAMWVALILRMAASLFRRSVLKSGPAFRWPWQRRQAV
jgi:ABC-2 type transport system permease protein